MLPAAPLFSAAIELACKLGAKNVGSLDGCWEHQIDEFWWMAINGHSVKTLCSVNAEVPPFSIYFQFNGWPAGICDAGGGNIAAGALANEDSLIAAINARAERL